MHRENLNRVLGIHNHIETVEFLVSVLIAFHHVDEACKALRFVLGKPRHLKQNVVERSIERDRLVPQCLVAVAKLIPNVRNRFCEFFGFEPCVDVVVDCFEIQDFRR